MTVEETSALLNGLIRICRDSERCFTTAAEAANTFDLAQGLTAFASQHALYVGELQAEVERLGGEPVDTGTLGSSLQQGLFHLKNLITGSAVSDICIACSHGEEAALKAYEEALQADLPEETHTLLARQLDQIKEVYSRLQSLGEVCTRS
jgi:uncharacterized protein (TIGR02284 family)